MAMSVGADSSEDTPMSDINTTPLVDVMLVLLIIFLITVPVVIQTIPLKLPDVRNVINVTKPENIELSVKGDGSGNCQVFWGQEPITSKQLVDRSVARLKSAIAAAGGAQNLTPDTMPEAQVRGDVNTPYKCIGGVVTNLQLAGFERVGFISQPPPNPGS